MRFILIDNYRITVCHREEEVQRAKSQKHILAFRECERDKEFCYLLLVFDVVNGEHGKTGKALEELAAILTKNLCGAVNPHIYVCIKDLYHYLLTVAPPFIKFTRYYVKPYSDNDKHAIAQTFIQTFADLAAKAVSLAFTVLADPSKLRQAVDLEHTLAHLTRDAFIWWAHLKELDLKYVDVIMSKIKSVLDFAIEAVSR
jgi:hypothetical protein